MAGAHVHGGIGGERGGGCKTAQTHRGVRRLHGTARGAYAPPQLPLTPPPSSPAPAGRTGRAGTRGRATSFYTERDSFLVAQIKTALAELEKGNQFAFATGKQARQEERALAAAFKTNLRMGGPPGGVVQAGAAAVKIDDKYAHMAKAATVETSGAADAAWDD